MSLIKSLERSNAYKVVNKDYWKFLNLVRRISEGTLKNQLIFIDGLYVRLFFMSNKYNTSTIDKTLIYCWTSNDFGQQDFCMTVLDDFFYLHDKLAQLFLLARGVGYAKYNNLLMPQYGVEKKRLDALKQLSVIKEDIVADLYASDVVKVGAKRIMLDIAEYYDRVFENPQGALEWKLRSKYVK